MLLLDADVLIDVQRGHAPAVRWFAGLSVPPSVPGLVVMELIQDANNRDQVVMARRLVAALPVVWPTWADCDRGLALFEKYHLSHRLGLLDALIGATAPRRRPRSPPGAASRPRGRRTPPSFSPTIARAVLTAGPPVVRWPAHHQLAHRSRHLSTVSL